MLLGFLLLWIVGTLNTLNLVDSGFNFVFLT